MRYALAIIFACVIGTPAAFAMPALGPNQLARADSIVQTVKHSPAPPRSRHSRSSSNGGIHPLVGSGNY